MPRGCLLVNQIHLKDLSFTVHHLCAASSLRGRGASMTLTTALDSSPSSSSSCVLLQQPHSSTLHNVIVEFVTSKNQKTLSYHRMIPLICLLHAGTECISLTHRPRSNAMQITELRKLIVMLPMQFFHPSKYFPGVIQL